MHIFYKQFIPGYYYSRSKIAVTRKQCIKRKQSKYACHAYFSRKIRVSISYEERQICHLEEIIPHSESSERSNKFLAYYLVSTGTSHSTSSYFGIANERWLSGVQTLHFLDAARIRLSPCFVRRMSRTVARTRKDKPRSSPFFRYCTMHHVVDESGANFRHRF